MMGCLFIAIYNYSKDPLLRQLDTKTSIQRSPNLGPTISMYSRPIFRWFFEGDLISRTLLYVY